MEEDTDGLFAADGGWGEDPLRPQATANTEEQTGISREPRFGIVSLRQTEIGRTFCGGCIGTKGRRMCIKSVEECDISSHLSKKAYRLFGDDAEVVFILAQPATDHGPAGSVHSSPTLPRTAFEEGAWKSNWSSSEKTLKAWQVSFASLSAQESVLENKASIEVCSRTSKAVSFAITPSKKRNAAAVAALGESPGDFEVQLLPMLDQLGPSSDTVIAALMGPAWGAVTQNVETVARVAQAAHKRSKAQEEDVGRDFEQVEFKLSALHALLGERSEDLGTQDVFSLLEGILLEIEKFKSSEVDLKATVEGVLARAAEPMLKTLSEKLTSQIQGHLGGPPDQFKAAFVKPLSLLLRRSSPDVNNPGGLWAQQLLDLNTQAQTLSQSISRCESIIYNAGAPAMSDAQRNARSSAPTGSGYGGGGVWGVDAMDVDNELDYVGRTNARSISSGTSTSASATPEWVALGERVGRLTTILNSVQGAVAKLQLANTAAPLGATQLSHSGAGVGSTALAGPSAVNGRLEALEKEVIELRGQLRMTGVTVGGITFDSPSDVKAWLALHNLPGKAYLFVDPLSLLSISDTVAADEKDATQERLNTERVKDGCTEATRYRASFQIEIPPILGKKGDPTTSPNERQLAAIPKFEDWNTGMGRDGVVDRLTDILTEGELSLSYQITAQLNGPAHQLASKMLTLSVAFWEKLGAWMTKYFGEIQARSQSRPQECWILVTHCVRRILSEARKVRSPGKTGQDHDMIWGALQAHSLFKSILDHKIQGHPKISVILQQHLVDHATPMTSFLELSATVKELQRQVGQHSKAQDRSVTFGNKQQVAAKPKGGGG